MGLKEQQPPLFSLFFLTLPVFADLENHIWCKEIYNTNTYKKYEKNEEIDLS